MQPLELLEKGAKELKLDLNQKQIEQFNAYMDLLIEWNEKINLTTITDKSEIITKHFLDSLTVLTLSVVDYDARIIDIGTGAGFPGIPMKILRDDLKITLLDSLAKRLKFLDEVTTTLELENISTFHSRAEDGGISKNFREKFDIATARAVANLSVLCEYCLPYVRVGGLFIALKGPAINDEIPVSKNAIKELGGQLQDIVQVKIPFSDLSHNIVIIKKVSPCPPKYPRKAGTPSKSPII